ncbi:MAG: DUF362 domain-containing protein [Candidatus Methylomirabilales bacterium]
MGGISRRRLLAGGLAVALTARRARAAASPVFLARTTDRAAAIRRGMAALGVSLGRGRRVAIKPNFNSADPYPASTHLDTLGALLAECRSAGAAEISIADRSGMGETRRVMEQKGAFDLARRSGARAVVLDETPAEGWIEERLPGGHWSRGVLFPRLFAEADLVLQTCCLKTHRFGGHVTLSLKNSVGMVAKYAPRGGYNYMSELHGSPHQRRMIAEINQLYRPALVVMDGLEAFTDGGPERGRHARPEVMVVGTDRVAVDAVGVALLRLHGTNATVAGGAVFDQEQIARAAHLGIGATGPGQVDLITDDAESRALADRVRAELRKG